jgi:thioesterase domain-containing protein
LGPKHPADRDDTVHLQARDRLYQWARRQYRPRPLGVPVLLVRASDKLSPEADLGWRSCASNLMVCVVPGDHLGILRVPGVDQLASQVRRVLDELRRS